MVNFFNNFFCFCLCNVCVNVCARVFNYELPVTKQYQKTKLILFFQDSLYVVSLNTMNLYEIDITSDALLDISKFPSGQPYTVNVYHKESTKSFKGKQCMFFILYIWHNVLFFLNLL